MPFVTENPMPSFIEWKPTVLDGMACHTLIVTGSREFSDLRVMTETLQAYWNAHELAVTAGSCDIMPLVLVSGHAQRGADVLAEMVWQQFGGVVFTEPAKWTEHTPSRCKCGNSSQAAVLSDNGKREYCKLAGIIRNELMVNNYNPSVVIAFFSPEGENKGTNHCSDYAREQHIPVRMILEAPKNQVTGIFETPTDVAAPPPSDAPITESEFVAGSL